MEACGGAHYWAREMIRFEADSGTVCEAVHEAPEERCRGRRGNCGRARERLVHQRTELVNALRACLYEYGYAVPQGLHQIKRIEEILNTPNSDLPDLMREECRELCDSIGTSVTGAGRRSLRAIPCRYPGNGSQIFVAIRVR